MIKRCFLSICIPTYNRKDFLIKTLTKISKFKEVGDIEVVVADDASDDNTNLKIQDFIKDHKNMNLVYKRFPKRMYFDKMVLSIVKIAKGDHCWLISDDDIPLPGSIGKIKSIITKYPSTSFIHMNYVRFDNMLKKVTSKRMVGSIKNDIIFSDAEDFFFKPVTDSYFKFLGTNTITMSTDVFDRKKWLKSVFGLKKYIGHNFIHSFAIGTLIKKYPDVYYIGKPSVQYLSNNHRVWPNNIWQDYNTEFLNYLLKIGYSKNKIEEMRKVQRQYEQREGIMKNKFLKRVYLFLRPLYVRVQYLYSKLNDK